jgi:hypothetical protein
MAEGLRPRQIAGAVGSIYEDLIETDQTHKQKKEAYAQDSRVFFHVPGNFLPVQWILHLDEFVRSIAQ